MVIYEAAPVAKSGARYTPIWWMTLGICIGFMGNFVDNLYWGFPWTFNYLESPISQVLNRNGVFPNLVFRQGFGILAAYCHIRAFVAPQRGAVNANRLMRHVHYVTILSILIGQAYVVTLYLVKHNIL
jgi:hypothetical protein